MEDNYVLDIQPNLNPANFKHAQVKYFQKNQNTGDLKFILKLINCHCNLFKYKISADCDWSDFSVWSPCSKSCGNGVQSRSRYVQRPAVNGGRNCTGGPKETRNCAKNACPGNGLSKHISIGYLISRENTLTIGYVFYFFFQLIASGTTSENGATAARIAVVDGSVDHEQSNKRQHSEENNVMDVQLRPELVIHMPVQVSLCIK